MPIRVVSTQSRRPSGAGHQQGGAASAGPTGLPLPQPPPDWPQKPPGISLCMIVRNEERFLAQCLRSVREIVDEICIVDTGSTDRTVEIAREFGAMVVSREWRNDFAWARNQALELATKRWILTLDADEELLPQSFPTLQWLKDAPAYRTGVWLRIYNDSDDYRGTGAMSHALVRIFPNHERIRYRGLIHEFATFDGDPNGLPAVASPVAVRHHGYLKDIVEQREKGRRNLEIVRAAVEREPNDPFHWFNLGSTAFLVQENELARDALEKMRALNGRTARGFIPNALAVLSELYTERLHQPEKGEEIAREALTFAPHYANAHFALGKALVAQRRLPEAREAYLAAIEDGAYNALQFVVDDQVSVWKAHSEIGSTYVMEGDDRTALEWFEKGLANRPTSQPLQINRARALERLGRFAEAEAAFRAVYEQFGDEQSTIDYINYLLRRHEDAKALEVIDRSKHALSPRAARLVLLAAAAVAQRNGWPLAERYLREAVEVAPGSADVVGALEAIYAARGDHDAVASLRRREMEVPPEEPADYLRRSHLALAEGRAEDARRLAEEGLRRFPGECKLRYNLALAYARLGEKERVVEELRAIGEGDADAFALARMLEAATLRELGRTNEALAAIERFPGDAPAALDAALLRASLLEEAGRADEAERLLRSLFDADRKRVGVELAALLLRRGRYEDARAVADAALV